MIPQKRQSFRNAAFLAVFTQGGSFDAGGGRYDVS
jgi:hypothetical protein